MVFTRTERFSQKPLWGSQMKKSKVGIIGSTSNLFTRFNKFKLNQDYEFLTIGRTNSMVSLDLNDSSSVRSMITTLSSLHDVDTYINFAGITKPDLCAESPWLSYNINVVNTIKVINALKILNKNIIFISSDAIFEGNDKQVNEQSDTAPLYPYGIQKSIVENLCSCKNVKSLRLSYVLCADDFLFSPDTYKHKHGLFSNFYRNVIFEEDLFCVFESYIKNFHAMPDKLNVAGPQCVSKYELGIEIANRRGYSSPLETIAQEKFFHNRARKICMGSDFLTEILGRDPMNINEVLDVME